MTIRPPTDYAMLNRAILDAPDPRRVPSETWERVVDRMRRLFARPQ